MLFILSFNDRARGKTCLLHYAGAFDLLNRITLPQILHKNGTDLSVLDFLLDHVYNHTHFTSLTKNKSLLLAVHSRIFRGPFCLHFSPSCVS